MSDLPSHAYWTTRAGDDYERQQQGRRAAGDVTYAQQEQWLKATLGDLARALGRPVRMLDFGCGFGRIARLLHDSPDVVYHGFDLSETMVAPLRHANLAGLEPFDERVRVASTAPEAFPDARFDLILTVSVLIHNPSEVVAEILKQQLSMLDEDGSVIVIENKLVPASMYENDWHGGCWLHAFVDLVPNDVDVRVHMGIVDSHDIYTFRNTKSPEARSLSISEAEGATRVVSRDELRMLGIEKQATQIARQPSETERIAAAGRAHDLEEELSRVRVALARAEQSISRDREMCSRLVVAMRTTLGSRDTAFALEPSDSDDREPTCADASTLESQVDELLERYRALESRLALRASIEASVRAMPAPTPTQRADSARAMEPPPSAPYVFDDERDRIFANEDARFDDVCHVFHQEWFGIRAAAGSLAGHKLAIRAERHLRVGEIASVVSELDRRGVRTVVIHAWSEPMNTLVRALRSATSIKLYLVWHGTTTQWAAADERKFALGALKAARDGLVHGWSAIRRGMESFSGPTTFVPQLLNAPPNVRTALGRSPRRVDQCLALAPSWNDLRKNLSTNLLAAQAVPRIARTYFLATDLELPSWIAPRIERTPYRNQKQMLEFMGTVDIVLNATTIDCHPMVDLEALSVETPTVRGPLFLDALEDHPYVQATVVENVLSTSDIARAIEHVLSIPPHELDAMMRDYRAQMRAISMNRYAEFLKL